jgi:glyoxylase-like metal-dependent hydrolase (beta-lactamase superfamily II)
MSFSGLLKAADKKALPTTIETVAPGVVKKTVGPLTVYAIADTVGRLDFSIIQGLSKERIQALVGQNPEMDSNSLTSYINVFLIKSPDGLFLVDTGLGNGDTLEKGIKAAGFNPEDVTDVFLTHFHGDHVNGLISGQKSLFPKATVWASKLEDRYWISEGRNTRGQNADNKISPYRSRKSYQTFTPGAEIKPGVSTIELYGHTPGHVGYLFKAGTEEFLAFGDIAHAYLIQFKRPDVSVSYDVDQAAAAETRAKIFKIAAEAGYLVAGPHLPYPGLGRIKADSPPAVGSTDVQGYSWEKER